MIPHWWGRFVLTRTSTTGLGGYLHAGQLVSRKCIVADDGSVSGCPHPGPGRAPDSRGRRLVT